MPLDSAFWENEKRRLLAIFLPRLTQMALTGMQNAARQAGIAFDNTLYSKRAEAWARNYTDKLLTFLDTTNKQVVGDAVADWISKPGATVGDLNDKLGTWFDPVRANRIAVTETTRAFAEGQLASYQLEGITEIRWNTNRDDETCQTCRPLNGQKVKIGKAFGKDKKGNDVFKPPAHVNCRCWISGVATSVNKLPAQGKELEANVPTPPEISGLAIQKAKEILPSITEVHNTGRVFKDGTVNYGSSFSLRYGNMTGAQYYSTSVYPDLTMQVEGKDISQEQVKKFIIDNIDLLSNEKLVVGTWYNPEENITYIDVSALVSDKQEAERLSSQYNQIGMYDLSKTDEDGFVFLGGSGKVAQTMPFRMDRIKR